MQSLMQSLFKRIYDPNTQEYFYYNAQTGQSSWGMTPRGLKTKPQMSPNVGDESDMLPPGWQATFDNATQRVYYVNESTGESSWTMPLMPSHMSDELDEFSHIRIPSKTTRRPFLSKQPPIGFLQRLEHLDLSHNALRWLPTTCHHLVRVKFVSAAFNQLERRPPFFNDGSMYVDWSNNPFKASEVTSRPMLDLVAKAKHDLAQRNYTTAAALFSNLLEQIASFPGVPKEVEPIRVQATFYRGICR
ncbi:hypothetical protein DYB37_004354 [Aphanomyces astaci]|uniref:WW domain-containing protein n=1 Tax=Aphanomyces astaci TaxID=112090 RepID=A0A418FNY1_APHAT|nr:hypothetical protein DYB37_004354 [Aphanomyces astaci]